MHSMRVMNMWQPIWPVDPPSWKSNAQDDPHIAVAVPLRILEGMEKLVNFAVER